MRRLSVTKKGRITLRSYLAFVSRPFRDTGDLDGMRFSSFGEKFAISVVAVSVEEANL
jgi:hypothetical protein